MTRRSGMTAAVATAVFATSVAFAVGAPLGVTSERLTVVHTTGAIPTQQCTLSEPVADTYGDQANPDTPHGGATTMGVASGPANRRAFLRFDLSTCAIPQNAKVTSATLRLTISTAPAETRDYEAARVAASWTEGALTWSNQPGVTASPTATVASGTVGGARLDWNVTTDVAAFVSGATTNEGWRIKDAQENAATTLTAVFASREHGTAAHRPSLSVSYYR
jgi:hypothetical protein